MLHVILVAVVMASCSQDVDINPIDRPMGSAIAVGAYDARTTRAATSLSTVIKDFKLHGVKQTSIGTYPTVFSNYVVWHKPSTAGTTASNTTDWEYVGIMPDEAGYSAPSCQSINPQEIKYWDYDAQRYIFWAVGKAGNLSSGFDETYKAQVQNLTESSLNDPSTIVYFTQPKTVVPARYGETVQLEFRRFLSRIRFGFYETIPGYAVKDVRFYTPGSDASPSDVCTLGGQYIKDGASLNFTCDAITPRVSLSYAEGVQYNASHTFGTLHYTKAEDNLLTGSSDSESFLGRLSSTASYAGSGDGYYTNILPNPDNTTPLTLKVDYTLLSTDGSGQTIKVEGATATVPGNFCHWQPNTSYTYLFKISDNTNGSTGGDVVGLYPITFSAFAEIPGTDNNQVGTITTFDSWSITTHQKNDVLNNSIIYYKGKEMEVSAILGDGSNTAKVVLDGTTDYVIIYHQATNNEWEIETTEPSDLTPILGAYKETVDRYANGFAYFIPDMPGTYRIEYWHKEDSKAPEKRSVKIAKVEDKVGFNIHFVLNGHGNPVTDVENAVVMPTLPVPRDDDSSWGFIGWYKEEELTNPADEPGTDMTEDITLYAKWKKVYTGEDLENTDMNE